MIPTQKTKEKFLYGYLICALWSSTDSNDEPLDKNYFLTDFSEEFLTEASEDCEKFLGAIDQIPQYPESNRITSDAEYTGHDFWLTRNGHGAGFWDGDLPEELGQELTEICKKDFPEINLYVGDDGKIYSM